MYALKWHIKSAYPLSVLKQSDLKCFRNASPVPFYLAHCCFIMAVLVHFDGDGSYVEIQLSAVKTAPGSCTASCINH